jgi:hypothetical protein
MRLAVVSCPPTKRKSAVVSSSRWLRRSLSCSAAINAESRSSHGAARRRRARSVK